MKTMRQTLFEFNRCLGTRMRIRIEQLDSSTNVVCRRQLRRNIPQLIAICTPVAIWRRCMCEYTGERCTHKRHLNSTDYQLVELRGNGFSYFRSVLSLARTILILNYIQTLPIVVYTANVCVCVCDRKQWILKII